MSPVFPIPGLGTDVDGDPRHPVHPDIGADERTWVERPMSGTYTIKQDGSGDFRDFRQALADINVRGLSGDVTLDVFGGRYRRPLLLEDVRNGPHRLTLKAHEGEDAWFEIGIVEDLPGIWLVAAKRIRVEGFRLNNRARGFSDCRFGVWLDRRGPDGTDSCSVVGLDCGDGNVCIYNRADHDTVTGCRVGGFGLAVVDVCEGDYDRYFGHSNIVLTNNMVLGSMDIGMCTLALVAGNSVHAYDNSKWLWALRLWESSDIRLLNNIFQHEDYAMILDSVNLARGHLLSDHNVFRTGSREIICVGSNMMDLAEWQDYSGQDPHSLDTVPGFVSDYDLHIVGNSPCIGAGTPVPGLVFDYDGDPRDPDRPCIGADEYAPADPGAAQVPGQTQAFSLVLLGNPVARREARVRLSLPGPGPGVLAVFDVSGRRVAERTLVGPRAGVEPLDLGGLNAGVYLVRLDAPGFSDSQKLVIQR